MAIGTITFAAPASGLQLEPIELSSPHPAIDKIDLVTRDGGLLEVQFHLIDVFNMEDAENIARPVLRSIVDRLAFEVDVGIGEPYLSGATLPKDASGSAFSGMKTLPVSWHVLPEDVVPDAKRREEIASLLEQASPRNALFSAYRFAITQDDCVTRFMFLYNILLQIHLDERGEERQLAVDDYTLTQQPDVPVSKTTYRGRVIEETIYRRLRNEIGHGREGVDWNQTRTDVADWVGGLQELARRSISQQP